MYSRSLVVVHSNYDCLLYCFGDKAKYWSKIAFFIRLMSPLGDSRRNIVIPFGIWNKKLCCRKEAARCFVSVLLQYKTSSAVFYYELFWLQIYCCVQLNSFLFSSLRRIRPCYRTSQTNIRWCVADCAIGTRRSVHSPVWYSLKWPWVSREVTKGSAHRDYN